MYNLIYNTEIKIITIYTCINKYEEKYQETDINISWYQLRYLVILFLSLFPSIFPNFSETEKETFIIRKQILYFGMKKVHLVD